MPIKPENKHLYPPDWQDIRFEILKRACNACEFCGLVNYAEGWRDPAGGFYTDKEHTQITEQRLLPEFILKKFRPVTIILTVAHLDQDPTNNDPENLRALCQKCHLDHDRPHHIRNRIHKVGQMSVFDRLKGLE